METNTAPQWCTSREAATKVHVSVGTIRDYARRGILPSYKLPSGERRYRLEDVMNLLTPEQSTDKATA
jgi:DNA-binding transcriptional MerR regulator